MFLATQFSPVSKPIFSCFLCLEQLGTALCQSAAIGDVEKVKELLANVDSPDVRGHYNVTPLHAAANHNSTKAAKLLLEHGAEIEARDVHNHTPLHTAA